MGLWQINVGHGVRANIWGNLNDPAVNARAAYDISGHGQNMAPWTTTHDSNRGTGARLPALPGQSGSWVTGAHGDWSGVAGYRSGHRDPTQSDSALHPAQGFDQIDAGASMDAVDSDHDGLTDEFERFAGLKVHSEDSDHDGLSDAFEAMRSHTDPLSADTDHDGKSDDLEYATGTDAGRLPGIAGVVGTGQFAHLERDGMHDSDHDGLSNFYERQAGATPSPPTPTTTGSPTASRSPSAPTRTPSTPTTTDYRRQRGPIRLRPAPRPTPATEPTDAPTAPSRILPASLRAAAAKGTRRR